MNPWKILGVHRAMSLEEIHKAYIALARQYHPDLPSGDKQKFSIIVGAYSLLKNPTELKHFINQQSGVGTECKVCKGKGAIYKSTGMTGRLYTTCNTCEGSGIIFKREK